jgi:hypothetical protein
LKVSCLLSGAGFTRSYFNGLLSVADVFHGEGQSRCVGSGSLFVRALFSSDEITGRAIGFGSLFVLSSFSGDGLTISIGFGELLNHQKTVIPMSYIRRVMQLAVAMLEASPTWVMICNGEPRSKMIYYHGGDVEATGRAKVLNIDKVLVPDTPPMALISQMNFPNEALARGVYKHTGTVKIRIIIVPPKDLVGMEKIDWQLAIAGNISTEINAQFGQIGKLGNGSSAPTLEEIEDATGALAGQFISTVNIDWDNL